MTRVDFHETLTLMECTERKAATGLRRAFFRCKRIICKTGTVNVNTDFAGKLPIPVSFRKAVLAAWREIAVITKKQTSLEFAE